MSYHNNILYALILRVYFIADQIPWISGWMDIPFTSLHVGQCISSLSIVFMFLTAEEIDGGMVMLIVETTS